MNKKGYVIEINVDETFAEEIALLATKNAAPRDYVEKVFQAASSKSKGGGPSARKKRIEINERTLDDTEKSLFRAAKAKEWNSWVANRVVQLLDGTGLDTRRVIRSRWVLTWKFGDRRPDGKSAPRHSWLPRPRSWHLQERRAYFDKVQ